MNRYTMVRHQYQTVYAQSAADAADMCHEAGWESEPVMVSYASDETGVNLMPCPFGEDTPDNVDDQFAWYRSNQLDLLREDAA